MTTQDELLLYAINNYPIGTVFINAYYPEINDTPKKVLGSPEHINISNGDEIVVESKRLDDDRVDKFNLYYEGKWAKIIKRPKKVLPEEYIKIKERVKNLINTI